MKDSAPAVEHRGNSKNLERFQWKPGQSGNPKGRPKGRTITEAINRLLSEKTDDGKTVAEALVEAAVKHAEKGNHAFFREIVDRHEGKVPLPIVGEAGGPVVIQWNAPAPPEPEHAEEESAPESIEESDEEADEPHGEE